MIDWNQVRSIEPFFDDRFLLCVKYSGEKFKLNIPEGDFHDIYTSIKNIVYPKIKIKDTDYSSKISDDYADFRKVDDNNLKMICKKYGITYSKKITTIIQSADTKEVFTSYKDVSKRYGLNHTRSIYGTIKYAIETYGHYKGIKLKFLYQKSRYNQKNGGIDL